jgi:methylase of polypeptide subunit release factors
VSAAATASDALAEVRDLFGAVGYGEAQLTEALGGFAPYAVTASDRPLVRITPGPLNPLARLLILGDPIPREVIAPALARSLVGSGLVAERAGSLHAHVRIVPFEDLLIACDPLAAAHQPQAVLGVEPSSLHLARLCAALRGQSALDLGTGGGFQALALARRSARVDGVEIDPRSLDFARLNRTLNGAANVELHAGHFFAPVDGRRYDLIVANLPYLVDPQPRSQFAHARETPPGDGISRAVVEGAAAHLLPGGRAVVLCSWIVHDPVRWIAPIADWLEGRQTDVTILRYGLQNARAYLAGLYSHLRRERPEEFAARYETGATRFAELGIEGLAWGALLMQRRAHPGPVSVSAFADVAPPGPGAGRAVARIFNASEAIGRPDRGSQMLTARLTAAGPLVIAQLPALLAAPVRDRVFRVSAPDGDGCCVEMSGDAAGVIRSLDGGRRLGEILATVAAPAREQVLETVIEMVAAGLLEWDHS